MNEQNIIICPKCGEKINVGSILHDQILKQVEKEYRLKSKQQEKDYQDKLTEIQERSDKLEQDKQHFDESLKRMVDERLKSEQEKLQKAVREQYDKEYEGAMKAMQDDLNAQTEKVKALNQTKAENEKLKREKEELRESIELEKQKEFSAKLTSEKLNIRKRVEEETQMRIKELEKKLEDQTQLALEMKRKAEQGSQQLQGEVQEMAIEDVLSGLFPFDIVKEVPKGIKGADIIHVIRNRIGTECGTILYESKRTKSFSYDWISKLKNDAIQVKADVCIIVTEILPSDMENLGQYDGVWICSYSTFQSVIYVIRESLIRINDVIVSQSNKGEKTHALYEYLTGNEFAMQIGAIVEGFVSLKKTYDQERNSLERIWKQREKQLERILLNTNQFIGSIKGIAGVTLPNLKQIESAENLLEDID